MRSAGLLCVLLACALGAQAFYEGNSAVKSLTPANFKAFLSKRPALVEFYAPWCGPQYVVPIASLSAVGAPNPIILATHTCVQVRALQEPHPRVVSCRRLRRRRCCPRPDTSCGVGGPGMLAHKGPPLRAVRRERAAKALEGIVTVAAVDADAHKELGNEVRLLPLLPDCCCFRLLL